MAEVGVGVEVEVDHGFGEPDVDQEPEQVPDEIPDQVPDEIPDQVPEISEPEQKQGRDEDSVIGGGEKKWPGWPGESVFRMLVPAQKVGSIIGRRGEFIKKIVEETKARIKILDGPPGTAERAVSSFLIWYLDSVYFLIKLYEWAGRAEFVNVRSLVVSPSVYLLFFVVQLVATITGFKLCGLFYLFIFIISVCVLVLNSSYG